MRLHRFIGDFDFSKKILELQEKELVLQLRNVLRVKTGEELYLCDGKGFEVRAHIESIKKNAISVRIIEHMQNTHQQLRSVTLYCALLKRENFELVAQKATEIGISELVPIQTQRTVKTAVNMNRIQKIMKEASEQCGRTVLPILGKSMDFQSVLEVAVKKHNTIVVFDKTGKPFNTSVVKKTESLAIGIGPEGGWSREEYAILTKVPRVIIASLGPFTLRAETAAIVATYLATIN